LFATIKRIYSQIIKEDAITAAVLGSAFFGLGLGLNKLKNKIFSPKIKSRNSKPKSSRNRKTMMKSSRNRKTMVKSSRSKKTMVKSNSSSRREGKK